MPKSILHLDNSSLEQLFDRLPIPALFKLSQLGITRWDAIRDKVFAKKRTLFAFDSLSDVQEFDNFFTMYYQFMKLPPPADPLMPYRRIFHSISKSANEPLPKYSRPTFCLITPVTVLNMFPNLHKLVLFRVKNISTENLCSVLSGMASLEYLALIDLNVRHYRLPHLMVETVEKTHQTMWKCASSPNIGGKIDWSSIWPIINELTALRELVLWGVDCTIDLSPQLIAQLRHFIIGQYNERNDSLLNICKQFGTEFRQLGLVQIDGSDKLYRWLCGKSRLATQLRSQLTEFTIDYINAFESGYNFQLLTFICDNFTNLTSLSICLKEGMLLIVLYELEKLKQLSELRLACFSLQLPDHAVPKQIIPVLSSIRTLHLKILYSPAKLAYFVHIFPNLRVIGLERSRVVCGCHAPPSQLVDVCDLKCETCLRLIRGIFLRFKHLPQVE